jgi:hypothetical protein
LFIWRIALEIPQTLNGLLRCAYTATEDPPQLTIGPLPSGLAVARELDIEIPRPLRWLIYFYVLLKVEVPRYYEEWLDVDLMEQGSDDLDREAEDKYLTAVLNRDQIGTLVVNLIRELTEVASGSWYVVLTEWRLVEVKVADDPKEWVEDTVDGG